MNSTLVNETRLSIGHWAYIRLAGAVMRVGLSDPDWIDSEGGQWWLGVTGADTDYVRRMAKRYLQA